MPQNWLVFKRNFMLSGAITPKIVGGDNSKYGGAPQLMLGNNPMKFEDSRSNGFLVMRAAKFCDRLMD